MPVGVACRGKSELHRADCQVTPGRREATERATENRPPFITRVRVKRWGKSPPRAWQQAWHGNPQSEQGQISSETRPGSPDLQVVRTTTQEWEKLIGWRADMRKRGWKLLRVASEGTEMVAVFGRTKGDRAAAPGTA